MAVKRMKVVIRKMNELSKETRKVLETHLVKLPEDFEEMSWEKYTNTEGLYGAEQYVVQLYTAYFRIKGNIFIKHQGDCHPLIRITDPSVLPSYFPLHDED